MKENCKKSNREDNGRPIAYPDGQKTISLKREASSVEILMHLLDRLHDRRNRSYYIIFFFLFALPLCHHLDARQVASRSYGREFAWKNIIRARRYGQRYHCLILRAGAIGSYLFALHCFYKGLHGMELLATTCDGLTWRQWP